MPAEVRTFRILVLDDNRDAAIVLVMLLIRNGYDAIAIHHGADAVDAAERFRPDCLISDITMPGVDSYEVARQFRSHQSLSGISLVALSAHNDCGEMRAAEFDHHLLKPTPSSDLLGLLYEVRGKVFTVGCPSSNRSNADMNEFG